MKIVVRFLLVLCLVVAGAAHEVARAQNPYVEVLPEPPRGDPIAPVAPGLGVPPPKAKPAPRPAPEPESRARGTSPSDANTFPASRCFPLSSVPARFRAGCIAYLKNQCFVYRGNRRLYINCIKRFL